MTDAVSTSLPWLDVFSPEYAADPHPQLDRARAENDIAQSERGLEAVSFDACQAMLRDMRLSPGMDELCRAAGIDDGPVFHFYATNVNNLDGPAHVRLRSVLSPYFTRPRMDSLRETVRGWVTDWLREGSRGGELELVEVVARRLPAAMFCLLLGVTQDDWQTVGRLSEENLKIFYMNPEYRADIVDAFLESDQYLREVLAFKADHPGDDLASGLIAAVARSEVTLDEVVSLLFILLEGSTDTTQSQLGRLFVSLAEHPAQWRVLTEAPEHVSGAVLEATRYAPGIWSFPRFAVEDGEVAGVAFERGTVLHVNVIGANWDPAVFGDPATFDVRRVFSKPPLNFGHGPHTCPGKPLALMEMEETLRAALASWTDFELAGSFESDGAPALLVARRIPLHFAV